jgi:hypothetical protein
LPRAPPLEHGRYKVRFCQLAAAHPKRVEPGEPGGQHGSLAPRTELVVDVPLYAYAPHPCNVAGRRAEAQPVQHVNDCLDVGIAWDSLRPDNSQTDVEGQQSPKARPPDSSTSLHDDPLRSRRDSGPGILDSPPSRAVI